ncbi:MAG: hypothetical protein JWR10_1666 [Rubritepida sp.]|nr:hypothetical protein [Rubritepida sp.]
MDDDDATIRLRPPAARPAAPPPPLSRRRLLGLWIGLGVALVGLGTGTAVWWWKRAAAPAPLAEAPPVRPIAPPPPPPEGPPSLNLAEIVTHRAGTSTALRWSVNPLVWVLDFPSLELQGQGMNRAAALLEKARTPRDRVLNDVELAAAIAADRRTASTWYFGHNYRASELARMFEFAARDGVQLNPQELWVQEQVELARRVDRSRDAAILTVPALGPQVDGNLRMSILMHELGHGQFYTLPFFAAHVMRVWDTGFSQSERAAVRSFLAAEGYDTAQEEVMANEGMAYLLYTPDRRFFDPARDLGWSDAQAERLRGLLRAGAPEEP